MSLAAYTAKTWTDYADSPDLSAANVQYMDSGIAAVTAEVIALELALPRTYQPISTELSALAGLSSTGYAKRTGAGAWSVVASIPQADVSGLNAALAGLQPLDSDLTAIAALTTTTFGRSLLTVVDAAAARTAIGAQAAGSYQASSSVLTSIATQSSGTGLLKLTAGVASLDSSVYALASSVPVASSTTPASLGTAAVGTGTTWARADHVHAMPTAVQVGAEPALGNPGTSGWLLSSTTVGVRSWVAPYSHPITHPQNVVDSASGWITTALAGKQAAGNYSLVGHTHSSLVQTGLAPTSVNAPSVWGTPGLDVRRATNTGSYPSAYGNILSLNGDGYGQIMIEMNTGASPENRGMWFRNSRDVVNSFSSWARVLDTAMDATAISNWNTAFSWGNHATAGYLTAASSLDPAKIAQTTSYKLVSDTEKATWNAKQTAITTGTTGQYLRGNLSLATFPTTWAWSAITSIPFKFLNYPGAPTVYEGFWPSNGTPTSDNFVLLWGKLGSAVFLNASNQLIFQTNDADGGRGDRMAITGAAITASVPFNGTTASFSSRCTQAGSTIWDAGNLTWGGNGSAGTMARADHVHAMPTAVQVGAEPALGNPGTSGWLLSSTTAGVRSWVAPYTHPATHPQNVVDSASGWITTALAGKQAAGNYVTTDTAQTISGIKTFSATPVLNAGMSVYTGTRTMYMLISSESVLFRDSEYATVIAGIDLLNSGVYINKLSVAGVSSHFAPTLSGLYDIGYSGNYWNNAYINYVNAISANVQRIKFTSIVNISSNTALPIVAPGEVVMLVGASTGSVTNNPVTNAWQTCKYRTSSGAQASAAAGGATVNLDLYGSVAFLVGRTTGSATLLS